MVILGLIVWQLWPEAKPVQGDVISGNTDVVGTRVGTSTQGVYSVGAYATTSYITKISNLVDLATYTIKIQEASTTPGLFVSFWGSNDFDCNTATTSTILKSQVLMKDINWYDIGLHITELAGSQTIPAGTTTLNLIGSSAIGKDITLVNLNYGCLKIDLSASSTRTLIQLKTK